MRVHHVALEVADVETTSAFYEDALGLHETRTFEIDGERSHCVGGDGGGELQFVEVDDPDRGVNHVAVTVADLDATIDAAVAEWDSEVVHRPKRLDGGDRVAVLTDPEGYRVELIEADG
ncbi:catechol 2,3-dioxygenase-like lactoylglutathione lyase family enzyme [Halarchaeum solikamskense]|uniref:VOC family protein n=1 Tax=Halarchaeum nitratireducens TaxID=489913 RepID=UPI001B3B0DF7|nr:VOC family protein [Halarchaeum solikamskense]MBP2249973.1 catechol 2,3-dioxygenase-like lactoylglutathione lyase family enzyme [Halarchaeum solikamskense]